MLNPSETPSQQTNFARGYPVAITAAVILSTTAIFIRYLTQTWQVPPLVLAFWRDLFVVTALALILTACPRPFCLPPNVSKRRMDFRRVGSGRLPSDDMKRLGLLPARKSEGSVGGLPDAEGRGPGFRHLLRIDRRHLPYLAGYGLILALFNVTWTFSVAHNGAAIATVLVNSSAAFAVLLGWWFLRERLSWVKAAAVLLAVAGCALVSGATNLGSWLASPGGLLIGGASGLCYALYNLMGRSAAGRGLNPWTTMLYAFAFATLYLFGLNFVPAGIIPQASGRWQDLFWLGKETAGWTVLVLLAVGPTLVGFGLINVSLTLLPAGVTNLILAAEPAFTALGAYLFLRERLTPVQISGGALLILGVIILRIAEGRNSKVTAAIEEAPA